MNERENACRNEEECRIVYLESRIEARGSRLMCHCHLSLYHRDIDRFNPDKVPTNKALESKS